MENFPSNSQSAKKPTPERPKVEKVVTGEVGKRKTPVGRRMAETFLGGDAKSVAQYVLMDVLIPAAKDMVSDAFSQGIDRMLFGEGRPGRRGGSRPSGPGGYVSYNRVGTNRAPIREEPRQMTTRDRANHNFDELLFATHIEADTVLERMYDLIKQYQVVTVADLYSLAGMTAEHTDGRWGWDELPGARVVRDRSGYLLDLPRPKPVS